ncbi:hypothetical protein [Sinomonas gamaensis]|uniref:hypothetical protein n=1 Tax=Sinomonas gamaensis TaxID=2565624 RepID=UPI001BB15C2F|nr:hypothetical protein [Sinomonas gamaensis]
MSDEVPEADGQEQRAPVWPEGQADHPGSPPLEAPDADYLEQQRALHEGAGGVAGGGGFEAAEADLLEQGESLPGDDEDEYPPATGEAEEI